MTPKPGVSLLDQLRALENSVDMLRHTLDKIVDEDELRVGLSKTAAAWAGQLEEGIAGARRLVAAGAPPAGPDPHRPKLEHSARAEDRKRVDRVRALTARRIEGMTAQVAAQSG
jgi:hypothetical protein